MQTTLVLLASLALVNGSIAGHSASSGVDAYRGPTGSGACLDACSARDVSCRAACLGVPSPDNIAADDTTACAAACPQGNGSPEATDKFANCVSDCIIHHFFSKHDIMTETFTMTAPTTPSSVTPTTTASNDVLFPTESKKFFPTHSKKLFPTESKKLFPTQSKKLFPENVGPIPTPIVNATSTLATHGGPKHNAAANGGSADVSNTAHGPLAGLAAMLLAIAAL